MTPTEPRPCRNCDGTGLIRINDKYRKTCPMCNGTKVER